MKTKVKNIAEMVGMLPLFIGTLLDGIKINTPVQLNLSEGKTLMFLYKHDGKSMSEYSKKVGLSKGSFTYVANCLVKKGFIERESVTDDRRKYALILTQEGKNVAKKIDLQFSQHISEKVSQLEEDDLNKLENALEIIIATTEILTGKKV